MDSSLQVIWDAIDDGQFAPALELLQKALRRSPNAKVLWNFKGLCLANLGQVTEALDVCERIRKASPSSKETYQNILDILKAALADASVKTYLNKTLEVGCQTCKTESVGRLWCLTAVRTGDFVMQRRAAVELKKGFLGRQYFFWVVMSMFSLAKRSRDAAEVKLLDMLMLPMMSKAADNTVKEAAEEPRIATVEELFLFLDILERQGRFEQMLTVLDGKLGRLLGDSQDFQTLKLDMLGNAGKLDEQLAYARACIDEGLDDWHFHKTLIEHAEPPQLKRRSRNDLLAMVAWSAKQKDGLLQAIKTYLQSFGSTLAAFEDLVPYTRQLNQDELQVFLEDAQTLQEAQESAIKSALLQVNLAKFRFTHSMHASRTPDDLVSFAQDCLKGYTEALSLGDALEQTDNQYGDDLLLIAVQTLLEPISHLDSSDVPLLQSAALLEYGVARAKHNYQFKLSLIRVYRLLGAWRLAEEVYKSLSIKQVQRDTLGYTLHEDATFEHLSAKQISSLKLTQTPYASNREETPDMLCLALERGTYSKIEEFLSFQERLACSYWQHRSTAEMVRLEFLLDKKPSAKIEIAERVFDNRSKDVMLNCLPPDVPHARPLPLTGPRNAEGAIGVEDLASLRTYQTHVRRIVDCTNDSTQEAPDNLVSSLRALSLTGKSSQPDALKTQIEALALPPFEAIWSRETLTIFGHVLEQLKFAAAALSSLKKAQRKALNAVADLVRSKTTDLVAALDAQRARIQARARTQVAAVRQSGLFAVLKNADESYVEQILDRVANAQAESLYALSNVAKTIRI